MVNITYIYHSCFVVSTDDCLLVYDYWHDPENLLPAFLDEAEREEKAVYFVVSHFHEDHYNPIVAEWCEQRKGDGWYLLPSYDTVKRRKIDKSLPFAVLRFGETVETPYFKLKSYRSTDVGVCTVATLNDGTTVCHAGDCNNWYFPSSSAAASDRVKVSPEEMEKLFLSIVRDIAADYPRLNHLMFPVDHRLGQQMLRGLFQFLQRIDVAEVHPMH